MMEPNLEKKNPVQDRRYQKWVMSSQESADADHNWLITLSDVMSLLLVFFIIFFAMSRVPGAKKVRSETTTVTQTTADPAPALMPAPVLENIQKDIKASLSSLNLDDQVMIKLVNQEILITMRDNITFPTGDSDILKESFPILDTLAEMILRYPQFLVEIDGHTDDRPINTRRFPSNWELSVARATSVLKYLITHHQLDPSRFTIKGNGEQRPLSSNMTDEQRAQNRRVEIRMKERTT